MKISVEDVIRLRNTPQNKEDNSKEKPEECECCEFETAELKAYENFSMSNTSTTHKWLCKLCASTMAGVALEYPELHKNGDILKAICHVGNAIIAEIRKSRKEK